LRRGGSGSECLAGIGQDLKPDRKSDRNGKAGSQRQAANELSQAAKAGTGTGTNTGTNTGTGTRQPANRNQQSSARNANKYLNIQIIAYLFLSIILCIKPEFDVTR
jgi:hypothetical protein